MRLLEGADATYGAMLDSIAEARTFLVVQFFIVRDDEVGRRLRDAIALVLAAALRSARLGLLSIIPNGLPILTTFGAWAVLVGEIGFSVATVASISLGIIVDDTVHLLSKYSRARRERGAWRFAWAAR